MLFNILYLHKICINFRNFLVVCYFWIVFWVYFCVFYWFLEKFLWISMVISIGNCTLVSLKGSFESIVFLWYIHGDNVLAVFVLVLSYWVDSWYYTITSAANLLLITKGWNQSQAEINHESASTQNIWIFSGISKITKLTLDLFENNYKLFA